MIWANWPLEYFKLVRNESRYVHKLLFNMNNHYLYIKVGCVFAMVIVSILPHAEFRRNDHREDAPHFNFVNLPKSDVRRIDFSLSTLTCKCFNLQSVSFSTIRSFLSVLFWVISDASPIAWTNTDKLNEKITKFGISTADQACTDGFPSICPSPQVLLFQLIVDFFYFPGRFELTIMEIGHEYINIYFHLYYRTAQVCNFWILVVSEIFRSEFWHLKNANLIISIFFNNSRSSSFFSCFWDCFRNHFHAK